MQREKSLRDGVASYLFSGHQTRWDGIMSVVVWIEARKTFAQITKSFVFDQRRRIWLMRQLDQDGENCPHLPTLIAMRPARSCVIELVVFRNERPYHTTNSK